MHELVAKPAGSKRIADPDPRLANSFAHWFTTYSSFYRCPVLYRGLFSFL